MGFSKVESQRRLEGDQSRNYELVSPGSPYRVLVREIKDPKSTALRSASSRSFLAEATIIVSPTKEFPNPSKIPLNNLVPDVEFIFRTSDSAFPQATVDLEKDLVYLPRSSDREYAPYQVFSIIHALQRFAILQGRYGQYVEYESGNLIDVRGKYIKDSKGNFRDRKSRKIKYKPNQLVDVVQAVMGARGRLEEHLVNLSKWGNRSPKFNGTDLTGQENANLLRRALTDQEEADLSWLAWFEQQTDRRSLETVLAWESQYGPAILGRELPFKSINDFNRFYEFLSNRLHRLSPPKALAMTNLFPNPETLRLLEEELGFRFCLDYFQVENWLYNRQELA